MSSIIKNRPFTLLDADLRPITDSVDYLAFRGEYTGTNLIYAGFARPGASEDEAVWQIFKIAYDGSNNPLSIKWPQVNDAASADYQFSWTDRATYTYS